MLTREQVELFHNNGFLKLPGQAPPETLRRLNKTILQNMRDAVEPVVRDDAGRVVRISSVWDRETVFREFAAGELVLDSLESLLGAHIVLTKNRHNHATLNLPGHKGDYWHRDITQLYDTPNPKVVVVRGSGAYTGNY